MVHLALQHIALPSPRWVETFNQAIVLGLPGQEGNPKLIGVHLKMPIPVQFNQTGSGQHRLHQGQRANTIEPKGLSQDSQEVKTS